MTYGQSRIIDSYGNPVQQSMTVKHGDYSSVNIFRPMLGVVLEVFPADDSGNRSAQQREDRRGYLHTCTVLVIQDGRGTHLPLENVIICPERPSGLDSYAEHLPRPTSGLVSGAAYNNQLNHINPYDLDGDWCLVGFLGGSIDQPFILKWWPHPRNVFDPATSGQTNPNDRTQGSTLDQRGRVFERINGTEFVVTRQGDVYLSTYRASSTLSFGTDIAQEEGRFPRTLSEDSGGSIKLWVKPSQSMEIDFNTPVDGLGFLDVADPSVPQTNPQTNQSSGEEKTDTYLLFERDRIVITVPDEISLRSDKRFLLESEEETTLTVGTDLTITVSGDRSDSVDGSYALEVGQDATVSITAGLDLSITGSATIASEASLGLAGATISIAANGSSGTPGSLSIVPAGITLGTGSLGGVVGGTNLQIALTTFASAVAAAQSSASVETAYATALTSAAAALAAAFASAVSPTTTV